MSLLPTIQPPVMQLGPDAEVLAAQMRAGGKKSIDAAAQGFESMFLSLLLKEMRQTLDPGGLFSQDTSDIHGGLFDMYLGQHLSQAGGIGIGALVKHYLQPRERHP
jgi:peptidoglycan hydrolase FlgJ